MDESGDGRIDVHEFAALMVSASDRSRDPLPPLEYIDHGLLVPCKESDGSVPPDSSLVLMLAYLCQDNLGVDLSEMEVKTAMSRLDKDGNGTLEVEEFANW